MRYAQMLLVWAVFGAAIALATGCDYVSPNGAPPSAPGTSGETPPPVTPPGGTASVTFRQVSTQILQSKCLECHTGEHNPNLGSWSSFAQDTRYVIPGNPEQSDVYVQVANGAMPRGRNPLNASELKLLYDWIAAGAPNN